MLSVSGHDAFESTVEEILSFPMRIVKTLSCIESLMCACSLMKISGCMDLLNLLCCYFLRIACSAGVHRTPFICLVIYGILLVPWHLVNMFCNEACLIAMNHFQISFCKQWCPRHMAAMW